MNNYTTNNTNAALEFAYAMGLKRPEVEEKQENNALSFAYAMGLKRNTESTGKRFHRNTRHTMVPQLRFI